MTDYRKPARSGSPNSKKYKEVGNLIPKQSMMDEDDDFHPRDASVNPKTSKRPDASQKMDREQPTRDIGGKPTPKKDLRGSEDDNAQLIKNVKITKGVINSHSRRISNTRLLVPCGIVASSRVRGGSRQRPPTN
jgi:hypothetical protein